MRATGLEPAHHRAQEPKSCVSANFTTPANINGKLKTIVCLTFYRAFQFFIFPDFDIIQYFLYFVNNNSPAACRRCHNRGGRSDKALLSSPRVIVGWDGETKNSQSQLIIKVPEIFYTNSVPPVS